jgi:ferric-dicitrate binding protein FerR (iron transport regulator)
MKRLIVFLLLLTCALCAAAQTHVRFTASHSAATTTAADTTASQGGLGLFATASGALASLLFVWSPFGAVWRRRLGSRAQLSALILALLLCSIMAVNGCSRTSSAPTRTAVGVQPAS